MMGINARQCIAMILLGLTTIVYSLKCDRRLDGISTPALPLEGRFWISLATFNRTEIIDQYMPNVKYTVSIEGDKSIEEGPQKFTRFLLTAENKNESLTAGTFDLADELLTQFSDKCPSAVTESSKIPKETVSVIWTSPPEGSGCVLIRATVVENAESWYMDEGGLVRMICQDPKAIEDDPGPVLPVCCACDEAKYEVTFEGLWSRNTHPKDFPSKGWLIRFSDVIGASHTVDYRFWRYDEIASEGLQQVAEFGSTRKLESELKDQSENIRTIIKARGITYPNVTGRTFAVFRVDRKHHLMSLVSMIVPSPDWIVGVSGLELCLPDCSWIEHKELNLYPFDAGTDDGITYTSPDSPNDPPEPIRRITSNYPNDTRSPFYDPSGMDMKPMAKLHLNRQRLYEKTCDDSPAPNGNTGGERPPKRHKNKACKTTQWGEWSPCPPTCGAKQLRQRSYRDQTAAIANNCTVALTDRRSCRGNGPDCVDGGDQGTELDRAECALGNWTAWSDCTSTCGEGYQTRSRNFIHKKHRKQCRAVRRGPELQQTVPCQIDPCPDPEFEKLKIIERRKEDNDDDSEENGNGEDDDTEDNEKTDEQEWSPKSVEVTEEWLQKCPAENYYPWSNWAPCTSTCGLGVALRSRQPIEESYNGPDECKTQITNCTANIISCDITKEEATEICNEPVLKGDCKVHYQRVYYDPKTSQCHFFDYTGCNGNRNNFHTIEECTKVCINYERNEDDALFNGIESGSQVSPPSLIYDDGKRIDCRYTDWSDWTRCNGCRGYTYRRREILASARNGGTRCPTKLLRKKKCHKIVNCSSQSDRRRRRYRDRKSVLHFNEIDCQMSQWSSWSVCNASCGDSFQHRTRKSNLQPYERHVKSCTKLVEFRRCSTFSCL